MKAFFRNQKVLHTWGGSLFLSSLGKKRLPISQGNSILNPTLPLFFNCYGKTRAWGFGETVRSQRTNDRDMRWERKNHGASLCTQCAGWCADYLLGPITLILINEHATHNLSEEGEKIWHMFGGCSVPAPRSGSAFLKLLGWEWQRLSNWDDAEIWFKPPLWSACVKCWHWAGSVENSE